MKRPHSLTVASAFASAVLAMGGNLMAPNSLDARETLTYSERNARTGSGNGGNFNNGSDIRIEADTNAAWVYITGTTGPCFWSNNVWIKGTGFASESGGALRFGEGQTQNTNPMIWTGNVALIGNATIGVQTGSPLSTGIITGKLSSESSDYELLIRGQNAGTTGGNISGIVVIASDNDDFNSPIRVGGGTLQIGDIRNVTATGYEWVQNDDGSETYKQNTAKVFAFDGSSGSVGSAPINLTSVFGDLNSHLVFKRSGNVVVQNAVSGTGDLTFDGTATYSIGENGSIANTLASVTVAEGATFVNCFNATEYNNQNNQGVWDYDGPVSGSGRYVAAFTTEEYVKANNTRITAYGIPVKLSNFTGQLIVGAGYRLGISSAWSQKSLGYALGATDYGQVWFTSQNSSYTGDLYLKGNGWGTTEYFGAVRFAGKMTIDLTTSAKMPAVYGNIYLMGDTRIQATETAMGLLASNIQNDKGVENAKLEFRGNRFILTGSNSYGDTVVNSNGTLQIGHVGTINGVYYDGTTGTLGVGAVSIADGSVLHFMRSNETTVANSIANNGQIIFDGGGVYSINTALNGNASVAADSWVTLNQDSTATWSGSGFLQVNNPRGDLNSTFSPPTLNNFTGALIVGTGYRWDTPNTSAAAIGATDGGQIWQLRGVLTKPIYIEGIGWKNTERFGAIRFAKAATSNDSGETMTGASSNVYLLGDARISARENDNATKAIISGPISGDYQLEINSSGLHDVKVASTVILTGSNSYGDTLVSEQDTLQIGHIGTINGVYYDGTTGTLGSGSATVAKDAKLVFMRSGEVSVPNVLKGDGTVVFDGSADYVMNAASTRNVAAIQIKDDADLILTGDVAHDVTANISEGIVTLDSANISLTLSEKNTDRVDSPSAALTFTNDLNFGSDLILGVALDENFSLTESDFFYLVAGTTDSFENVNLSAIALDGVLSSDYQLTLVALDNGMALAATNIPEPSTLALLVLGAAGLFALRASRRSGKRS